MKIRRLIRSGVQQRWLSFCSTFRIEYLTGFCPGGLFQYMLLIYNLLVRCCCRCHGWTSWSRANCQWGSIRDDAESHQPSIRFCSFSLGLMNNRHFWTSMSMTICDNQYLLWNTWPTSSALDECLVAIVLVCSVWSAEVRLAYSFTI